MCVGSGIRNNDPAQRLNFNPAGILKSFKPQASSLTAGEGYYRMNLERNNYGK
jgi:hypothetical protein